MTACSSKATTGSTRSWHTTCTRRRWNVRQIMQAHKLPRERVLAFVESEEGRQYLKAADGEWKAVMDAARNAGFIVSAYGGTAVLATYKAMMDEQGTDGVVRMLQMSGIDIPMEVE